MLFCFIVLVTFVMFTSKTLTLARDIISNKKPIHTHLTACKKEQLMELYDVLMNAKKIETITELFLKSGVPDETQESIKKYTFKASKILEKIDIDEDKKLILRAFTESLIERRV